MSIDEHHERAGCFTAIGDSRSAGGIAVIPDRCKACWIFMAVMIVGLFVLLVMVSRDASGSDVTVQRSMKTEQRLPPIILRCLWGAVEDGLSEGGFLRADQFDLGQAKNRITEARIRLVIDGQPRTGIAWLGAAYRVAGYALDTQHRGSVEYSYRLHIQGYSVSRNTRITDEHVTLTTYTGWVETVPILRSTKRIPIYVTFRINAFEAAGNTLLVGTGWGVADCSDFRCGLVRGIADQRAADELRKGIGDALDTVRRTGEGWYSGGAELGTILDRLRDTIELGRKVRQ